MTDIEIDAIGDLVALRLLVQRLYGLLTIATKHDNSWLERQREEAIATVDTAHLETLLIEDQREIRRRAEDTINAVFDGLRLQP
jgi:hypothetical protein